MTPEEAIEKIKTHGYPYVKLLSDERWAALSPMNFTTAILMGYVDDDYGYEDRWCYNSYEAAKKALDDWDGTGEPRGWHRHPSSGRRVDESGNLYVRP